MIIGLTGKKGSGKDTIADYLVEAYGFQKIGYSDVMYDAVCALWGITLEQALEYKTNDTRVVLADGSFPMVSKRSYTWREFLQRFGTEMGRTCFGIDGEFWIDQFNVKYLEKPDDFDFEALRYVVRDVRFDNEAENLYDFGGDIWEVQRPGYDGDDHVSEQGISTNYIRGDIGNDGSIEELHTLLDDWMFAAYGRNPT